MARRDILLVLGLLARPAMAVDLSDVQSDEGWTDRGTRRTDVGEAQLWVRPLPDAYCVRAAMPTEVPVERLLAVAADIPAHTRWSTQQLLRSEVLQEAPTGQTYWQYLDVPDWMLVSDRYWVVRGVTERPGPREARFTWIQLPHEDFVAADERARALSDDAIRLPITVGEWRFEVRGAQSWATYSNCADPGGRLPDWVVRFAATKTVPENLADLVREARRREAAVPVAE